ncbi:MAG: rhodanese-like domain-containing protein [Sandaracinus sp.]|nr:rhodanese-like domain-containing protein [Sandaracinus sp.]
MPRIGTLALLLALGCASSEPAEAPSTTTSGNEELPAAPTLTGPEARALVADGAFLLDVTRADRAAESFVEGRTNIPFPELRDRLAEVPRDRIVVVYCLNGRGSPRAGALLQAEGYDVRVLGARANWDAE